MVFEHLRDHGRFRAEFQERTGVAFDWGLFTSERWPIDLVGANSVEGLARCFAPWYAPAPGRLGWRPLRITEVPHHLEADHTPRDRSRGIREYVGRFREEGVRPFALPAYALPGGEFLILDGNHRLSALAMAGVAFAVTLAVVVGPLRQECLPDLVHWQADGGT